MAFTFDDYVAARLGKAVHPAVLKLYRTHGAYRCKPKRKSRGLIWCNRAFWWCVKGYYRPGFVSGRRPPLQHLIWSHYHRRPVPKGYEVFFKDRDRHNFTRSNLELLSKAACHQRIHQLGETRPATHDVLCRGRQRMWTRKSRERVDLLLQSFRGKDTHDNTIKHLSSRIERLSQRR